MLGKRRRRNWEKSPRILLWKMNEMISLYLDCSINNRTAEEVVAGVLRETISWERYLLSVEIDLLL